MEERQSGSATWADFHSASEVGRVWVREAKASSRGEARSKTCEKILEKLEREGMLPINQRKSESKNIIFPPC